MILFSPSATLSKNMDTYFMFYTKIKRIKDPEEWGLVKSRLGKNVG